MQNKLVHYLAVACVTGAAFTGAAHAQTSDDAIRRLEARIDALAKENAALRTRLTKVEAAARVAPQKQEQGYAGAARTQTGPSPRQVAAAREAFAADMPMKYAAPAAALPAYNWSGFYLGGHVGYGWGEAGATPTGITGLLVDPFRTDNDGWLGGATFGFNYQNGRVVVGYEGEFSWSGIKGDANANLLFGLIPGASVTGSYQNNWIFTSAGRLGVAFDTLLIYGKAGIALAENEYTATMSVPLLGLNYGSTITETEVGWLVGAGLEWAVAGNWTMKVEGSYMDFGQKNRAFAGLPILGPIALPVNADIESHIAAVKFGVNYRFGDFGKAPVMAKY